MMLRRTSAFLLLLTLGACGSMSETQHTLLGEESTSLFSQTLPGLSDLDTVTAEDRAEEKWWDRFYGGGWGNASGSKAGRAQREGVFTGTVDAASAGSHSDSGSSSSTSDSAQ